MPDKAEKKSIWNKLFIAMTLIVALLLVSVFYISYKNERFMDTSYAYKDNVSASDRFSDAVSDTFADRLVISDNTISLEGVSMSSVSEKALLFDIGNDRPVFAQGIYDRAYPASITKIMTAIVAIKYGNMNDVVTMQPEDFALEEGSQVSGMTAGDTVTMEQLFKTLLVYSANDAAMAIARHISGSVEEFVKLMNEEARSLGMTGTHFVNPHGLHDVDHYTCAYDIYLMLNAAKEYTMFTDTIRLKEYQLSVTRADGSVISYRLDSTDKYLTGVKQLPQGVTLWGGKTGTTPEAGSCLSIIVQNTKGVPFIAVVMNADNSSALYSDMNTLLSQINNIQ